MCVEDDNKEEAKTEATDESGRFNYLVMLQRDKRRWAKADLDGDGELSKEEFASFTHPEDADHMKDVIVDVWFALFLVFVILGVWFSMSMQLPYQLPQEAQDTLF